jgi:hypothetical protein
VWIFPVVLGSGKRLFGEGAPAVALKLVDSQVSSTGVVMATYDPTGEIPKGSFALEEPAEAELGVVRRCARHRGRCRPAQVVLGLLRAVVGELAPVATVCCRPCGSSYLTETA